jgi:hypothetical protein
MLHAYFYTICLVFRYTSWRFYAFSGTNLLRRWKVKQKIFSELDKTKAKHPDIKQSFQKTEEETEPS